MAQKNIDGDLNVTGAYKQNGAALATGTKLYRHELDFSCDSSAGGSLLDDVALPLYIISTRQEPYTLNDFEVRVPGSAVINISCDGGIIFSHAYAEYSEGNDYWNVYADTGLANGGVIYENVTLFSDTVTEL